METQISELKAKKAAALDSEDYDSAKQIKGEIDSLSTQIDGILNEEASIPEQQQQQQVTCTGQTTFSFILLYEIVCCCKA